MNVTIERKKTECNALPNKGPREEILRKSGVFTAGKADVYYYSPAGKKIETKPQQLTRQLGETQDVPIPTSTFDFQSGKILQNPPQPITVQRTTTNTLKRKLPAGTTTICSPPGSSSSSMPSTTLRHQFEFSRGMRNDVSLVPPIRQTASIFKQPVTVIKNHEGKVKHDIKHGSQEKPKQLFWEKRLEGLRSCDVNGTEFDPIELPKAIKPVGPYITDQTLLQSVATSLHISTHPVTGQTAPKPALVTNAGVYLNPDQPLMHLVSITDDDIRRQEDRVTMARRRLQEALKG